MKQSTFSAVMANSIKNLLQGYTKGIRFVAVLMVLLTMGIGQAWAEGTETFETLTSATDYKSRSWTGVNGQTWSATLARTDQKITGNRGLTFSNASSGKTITMKLTEAQRAAGIGTFTFKYKHPYSDSSKNNTFSISVNGSNYSSGTLSYTSSSTTKTITINAVPNSTSITITITGTARLCVDDFSWTSYASNKTVYLKPTSAWDNTSAKFAVYYFNNSTNTNGWSSLMTKVDNKCNNDVYKAEIPSSYTNLIFVRLNNTATAGDWDKKWDQTADLTLSGTNNMYTISAHGSNGGKASGSWSAYKEEVQVTYNFQKTGISNVTECVIKGQTTANKSYNLLGWKLEGWYKEAAYTNQWNFSTTVTSEMTLYAKWSEPATTTVYLNANSNNVNWTQDNADIWVHAFMSSTGEYKDIQLTPVNTCDVNWLKAEGIPYGVDKLIFLRVADGAGVVWSGSNLWNQAAEIGYSGSTSYYQMDNWSAVKTATAYQPSTYTISYNSGGGTGSMASTTVECDGSITLPANSFTRTGYTFNGWKDAGGKTYTDKATISNVKSNITLTAQWKANTYYVKFNANNGSGSMSNQTFTYGTEQNLTANAFTRTGYTFAGWNTKADGTGTSYTDKQSVSNLSSTNNATVTLYAQWTPITYSINWVVNGAPYENGGSKEAVHNSTYSNLTLPTDPEDSALDACYSQKVFVGWSTTDVGHVETNTKPTLLAEVPTTSIIANTTFYAVFATGTDGGTTTTSKSETLDFSNQGYANSTTITSLTIGDITAAFNKGSNSNDPKYYTSGTAVRVYGGGYFTVSGATGCTITKVVITFGSEDGSNNITTNAGTYSNGTWTGSASSVKFTVGGTSGNRRIKSLSVTYSTTTTAAPDYSGYVSKCYCVTGIALSMTGEHKNLDVGETNQLLVAYTPTDATCDKEIVSWTSSDDNVISVTNSGLVTALRSGNATITATTAAGVSNTYTIVVNNPACEAWYLHYWNASTGGDECFYKVKPDDPNDHEWRTGNFSLPSNSDEDGFVVNNAKGEDPYKVDQIFRTGIGFADIQRGGQNCGTNPYPGQDAYGQLSIYDDSETPNRYIAFYPAQYLVTYGKEGAASWEVLQLNNTTGYEYESEPFMVPNGYKTDDTYKYWVGITKHNGSILYVDGKSSVDAMNTVNGLSTSDMAGKWGTWHIYSNSCANNWYCEFISYYRVDFDLAGGEGDIAPRYGKATTPYVTFSTTDITAPTRDGYTFLGWKDQNNKIYAPTGATVTINNDFTLTALWKENYASDNCRWEEVTIDDIEYGDEVVVTMGTNTTIYALHNTEMINKSPKAKDFSVIGNYLEDFDYSNYSWYIIKTNDGYQLQSCADNSKYLYGVSSYITISNTPTTFSIFKNTESGNECFSYIANSQVYYLGHGTENSEAAWKRFTSTNHLATNTLKFYKKVCLPEGHYRVTWDANGGQWSDGSTTKEEVYAEGATINKPDKPKRDGYEFTEWAPNPTTMPDENTTFTAQWAELHTITWMVGSSSVLSEDVANGTGVTKTPASNPGGDAIGDCADTFLGWSEKSAGSTPQDAAYYDDLCTAAQMKSKHTSVTGDKTFYAVFATKEGSSETTQMYKLVTNISGGKEYIFATGNSAGSVNGLTCDANSNLTATSLTVKVSDGLTYIETPASNNVVWNITGSSSSYNAQNKGQSGKYLRCYGTSPNAVIAASAYALYWSDSKGLYGKSNSGSTSYYLYYDTSTSKWGAKSNASGRVYAFEKSEVTVDNTTYSNYVTNCCALAPATNLTVSGTTSNTATLTWTAPSPTTGITKLQVRNADNDAVVVDDVAVGTTTATITGLTECTKYNYYVASVGDCEVFSNTVTAQPFSNAKTVNYDYNGGSGSPASFTTSCENQVITLPTATHAGYDFNGWYTAATGGTKVGDAGDTYNPTTSPITLYAQWTKQIYIISFHANGGTGTMANQSADENDVVAQLNANQFTRDGYAFVGWNTKANGTGIAYADQATDITLTGNLTLYAQWAPVVTLNDAGTETTTHPATVGGTITLPDGENACDPYEFVGWTIVATGDWNEGINEPALVATTYTPNAPKTLYAVYKIQSEGNANAFKLSFEGGNGKTYYVGEYGSSPYLRGYSNITEADAVTFIRKKMFPNDDTKYYLYLEHLEEYLYCSSGNLYTTSNEPSESQGWVFHTVGDKIQIQVINQERYLSYSDRDEDRINITTHSTGSQESFNMLSSVTSTYVASPLCNQEIEIIFETGNGDFVDNAPATNPLTVSRGDVITLPTCEYPGYEFMGWLKDEQQLDPSDIPLTYYTGDYTVNGTSSTITFYAYYKAIPEEVEFTGKDDAELLMYYYDGTADYYYAVSHAAERGELSSKQNCFNATTWTFTNVGNMQYYIQDETGKYLGAYSDGDNDLILSATPKVWTFTEVNGLWKMVCENSPSRALMYISTGKKFTNAAIRNEGNGSYSYVALGICPSPTYTTNPVLTQGFTITNTVKVTSASGQKIKAASALTLETRNIELPCTFTIAAPNITFYDNTGAEVTELESSAASEQFELHFAYKPTAENTMEYPTVTITDDEHKTYTIKNRIYARSLPDTFAIVAKVGNLWYALPSQGLNSSDVLTGYPIEVDDQADPTIVKRVPENADWSLRQVYAGQNVNATKDRFKQFGANMVFVNNENTSLLLSASRTENYLLTDANYTSYQQADNQGLYEWTPATTDLETYTLTNANPESGRDIKLSMNITNIFGVHKQNVATTELRFLPIENRYTQASLQVVEWRENSIVVMYTGNPAQTATLTINGTEQIGTTSLNASGVQKDLAIYELPASGIASKATQRLCITIGTSKKWLTIPYIINNSITDVAILNNTNTTKAVAAVTDVVVLNEATFIAAGTKDNKYTFRNITVYGGGKLFVPASAADGFGIYSLVMRLGTVKDGTYTNSYPQLVMNGKYSNTSGIYLDYITTYERYYALSVPYTVKTKDIKYPAEIYGDNLKTGNKASFAFQYYDGETRATGATGWKDFDETVAEPKLTPYQGYTFWGAPRKVSINGAEPERPKFGIHRIPLTGVGADVLLKAETSGKTIDIIAYPAERPNDMGWNFLGNPYLAQYGGLSADNELVQVGLLEQEMIDGKWTGGWKHTGNLRYITTTTDGQTYTPVEVDKATFSPFNTFFIQAATKGALSFVSASRAQSLPARHYAAQQEAAKEITTGIILTGNNQTDRTGLLIADNFTEEYDFNADLSKFENIGINLYTIGKDGKLAYMAINQALAEQPIPVGYSVPVEGLYTVAFDEDRYNATDISALYLIDYDSNEKTNLLHTDYSFVTAAGTNNQRFALQVAFAPENATNVEWVGDATIQVGVEGHELILNNLPTDAAVHVFDALGRLMYHTPHAPTEMQLTLPTGYYLVRIADKQNAVVTNIVIP